MLKNKKILIICGIILICLVLLGSFFLNSQTKNKEILQRVADISFKYNNEKQTNVYNLMEELRDKNKISFTEKNYAGMGEFITSINEIKNSGERNWIYYVNGTKAQIGVSDYKINIGDIVSWKYEKTNF